MLIIKKQTLIIFCTLLITLCVFTILEGRTPKELYHEKLSKLKDNDVNGHYDLGVWCKDNGLMDEAKEEFKKVIRLYPEHANAQKELGCVKFNNSWITEEEKDEIVHKEKGLIKYGDKWVPLKEMELLRKKERVTFNWDFEYKIQSKHYIIYTSTTEEEAKHIKDVLESLYIAYNNLFGIYFDLSDRPSTFHKVKLFKNIEELHEKVPQTKKYDAEGYYDSSIRFALLHYNRKRTIPYSNAIHECTHQLTWELFHKKPPVWFSEGIACYMESSTFLNNKLKIGKIDLYSDPGTWGLDKDKLIDIKKCISLSYQEWENFSNKEISRRRYFTCWILTHFLFHYQGGIYKDGFFKYIKMNLADIKMFEKLIDKTDIINKKLPEYVEALAKSKND